MQVGHNQKGYYLEYNINEIQDPSKNFTDYEIDGDKVRIYENKPQEKGYLDYAKEMGLF